MVRIESFARGALALGAWGVLLAGFVTAQAPQYRAPRDSDGELRWQFKKGQALRMFAEQNLVMSMTVQNQTGKSVTNSINEMTLSIDDVDSEGTAKAVATIDRMTMEVEGNGQRIAFDSSEKDASKTGPEAEIAQMIRPMIGKKMTQDLSPNGKISNVNVPDDMLNFGGNPAMAGLMNKKNIEEMSTRGSMEFPHPKLEQGYTWQMKAEMDMGPMKVATTTDYKYLGVKEGQDGPLHVIEAKISMSFPPAAAGVNVQVTEENSSGTFYFDGVRGRMRSSELLQDITMKIGAGGQSMDQHLQQSMRVSFEEASE